MLRHVRAVLRRHGLELTLVEHRPHDATAFAPLHSDEPTGPGLAVIAPDLPAAELPLIQGMLGEAALDVAGALDDRETLDPDEPLHNRTSYHGIFGAATAMQELYGLLDRIAPSDATVLVQGENG
ncbi:MAG TPA: hypothetical protein VGO00_11865, partial [Kofleriaceae bacterium]|nr:hypothetical protein [Kofleriaceae bacterium]